MNHVKRAQSLRFSERIGAFFSIFTRPMDHFADVNARMERLEELTAMSDDDLDELGMRREDAAHHVFRDMLK